MLWLLFAFLFGGSGVGEASFFDLTFETEIGSAIFVKFLENCTVDKIEGKSGKLTQIFIISFKYRERS
jgi:hypothetical protein